MKMIPRKLHFYYLEFQVLSSHLFSVTLTVHNHPWLISDSKILGDKCPKCVSEQVENQLNLLFKMSILGFMCKLYLLNFY